MLNSVDIFSVFSKGQTETLLYRFLAKGGGYVWMKTQATTVCDKHSQRPQSVMCVNYVVRSAIQTRNYFQLKNNGLKFKILLAIVDNTPFWR